MQSLSFFGGSFYCSPVGFFGFGYSTGLITYSGGCSISGSA